MDRKKDVRGKELFIDDLVAYAGQGYVSIYIGKIARFTPKMVVVASPPSKKGYVSTARKYPRDLVKIDHGGDNELS